ncbi:SDR family oxidoreductase [Streptomyces sp. NPDC002476]|uniref:SDR family oxidoreductase n=1 Tax=Streptomyces sp. NPDC002476 TaxID=3364648 RepID=UPI0036BB23C5
MRERGGGRIINLASIGGLVVDGERSSVYDASKAAVVRVTKNTAHEWGRYGIGANAIVPDCMRTALTTDLLTERAEENRLVDTHSPLGRIGESGDPGGAVVFLVSETFVYVTGHTLAVGGGRVVALRPDAAGRFGGRARPRRSRVSRAVPCRPVGRSSRLRAPVRAYGARTGANGPERP